jgi:hypothetical protein
MSASKYFQKMLCVGLLAVLLTGSVFAQTRDVLDLVPAQSLLVVRVNQFDTTLGQVDKFLTGLAPMPVQMAVKAQLGEVLGSAEAKGINMNGDFAAFVVAGESYGSDMPPMYPGVLIPISNYDQFIEGNPNCGKPDENGVSAITGPDNRNEGTPWLIAIKAGNYALVTMGKLRPQVLQYQEALGTDGLVSIESMASRLAAVDAKAAGQAPVWAYGNVAQASTVFKPLLDGKIDQFKGMITQKVKEDSPQGQIMDIGVILDMYGAMLEMLMDQTQSLSLAINPQPDVLRITETISAVPGSDLAAMLAKDNTGQTNSVIGFAADGAAMGFAGTIGDSWKAMYDKVFDLIPPLMGDSMTPESIAQMEKMTLNMIDTLEGPVAGTFSIDGTKKPIFGVKYVFGVKDADKFKALLKEESELFNESGFADLYKGMGIEMDYAMTYGAATYKGVSIDSARLSLKSTQPDSPAGKAIEGMYGGGFDYRWAVVGKLCAVAVGADVDAQIHQMIDQIKAGTANKMGSDMRGAYAMLPGADKADFVVTYNYVRILNMVGAIAKSMGEEGPDINVPTSSHLSIAGWGGKDRARIEIAVPKQHIMEMIPAFMAMSQMNK